MFAKPLEEYEVVYFIFDYPDGYSFWNKNVDFPLTLAFCDSDGKILDFKDMDANSEKSVGPDSSKVKIVVEANKDTFKKLGIKVGDKLILKDRKLILEKKLNEYIEGNKPKILEGFNVFFLEEKK